MEANTFSKEPKEIRR